MQFDKIPENVLDVIKDNTDLVAKNAQYLKSIGIKNPDLLIHIKPELFILATDLVKEKAKVINIELVNEDPYSILDMME